MTEESERQNGGTGGRQVSLLMEHAVLLMLFFALLAGVAMVVMPFAIGVMFGGIIAIAAWPLRQRLMRLGLSAGLTAVVLLVLILAFVILPLVAVAPGLASQLSGLFDMVTEWVRSSPRPPAWLESVPLIGSDIRDQWLKLLGSGAPIQEMLAPYTNSIRAGLVGVARGIGESLLQVLLAMVFATTFWTQGDRLAEIFLELLRRLGGGRLVEMAEISVNAVRGVFYGVVGTAVIQAAMMAVGLMVAGVPGAVPLGFLTLLLALSQVGGLLINLVWGGAAYWLYANDQTGIILWLLIGWGILITIADNVLKPLLIGTSITMPLALVIVGVFGGFLSLGFLGLFVGPVIIAVAYSMITAWRMTDPA
jgi:predicted PurR-regulated permease PerM